MRNSFAWALALAILFTFIAAGSQELPTENPSEVWVKGRKVRHSWVGGRVFIETVDAQALLRVSSELKTVDLVEALEEAGGYEWSVTNGKFEAKRDASQYATHSPATRPSDRRFSNGTKAKYAGTGDGAKTQQPRPIKGYAPATTSNNGQETKGFGLTYEVVEIDTEWGYKWGAVRVTNSSSQVSDPCVAYCEFQDGFGRTYSEDWWPVKSLQPGEQLVFEISSGVETKDTSITPTGDNIAVYFMAKKGDPRNAKSRKEAMQQAKQNKKSTRKGLDLQKHTRNPNGDAGPGW